MKKLFKVLSVLFLIFVLLLGLAAVAVKIYLTPERVKDFIEKQVSSQLHREVKLGEISINVLTGLSVSDFALSESPDFSKGTFVAGEKFQIRPQLLPLLSKKFYIDQLTLIKPRISIIRNSDGKTFNFSSLTSGPAPEVPAAPASTEKPVVAAPPAAAPASPLAFLVSKVVIQSGQLSFVDLSTAAMSTEITNLDVSVRNVSLVSPCELKTSFDVKNKLTQAKVAFDGVVHPLKGSAKIKNLTVSSGASKIQATGDVDDLAGGKPSFDLNMKIEKLEPALLSQLGAMPSSVHLKEPIAGDISIKGNAASMDMDFKLALGQLALNGKGTIKDAAQANRRMKLSIDTNQFPINSATALLPPNTLPAGVKLAGAAQLSAQVNGGADQGDMNLKIDATPLDVHYSTSFVKAALTPMTVAISGHYSLPFAMDIKEIRFDLSKLAMTGNGAYKSSGYWFNLASNKFPLEDISPMVAAMKDYGLKGSASVTAKIGSAPKGPVVKGNAKLLGDTMNYTGVALSNIQGNIDFTMTDAAGTITSDLIKHQYFSGQNLKLVFDLKDAAEMAKIKGTSSLKIGKGEFQNIQQLMSDSKMAKIFLAPLGPLQKLDKATKGALKLPDFNHVDYQEILGDYTFKNGVMNVTRFDLNGAQIAANMKGTVGLVGTQPLNLAGQIKIAAGMIGGLVGDTFNDDQGRTVLNMTVKGTVMDPLPSIDMKDINKKVLDTVKDKYGDQIKDEGQKLLKGLFNK